MAESTVIERDDGTLWCIVWEGERHPKVTITQISNPAKWPPPQMMYGGPLSTIATVVMPPYYDLTTQRNKQ